MQLESESGMYMTLSMVSNVLALKGSTFEGYALFWLIWHEY